MSQIRECVLDVRPAFSGKCVELLRQQFPDDRLPRHERAGLRIG